MYKLVMTIISALETAKKRFQPCVEVIVNKIMTLYPEDWNPDYLRLMRSFVKFFADANPEIFLPVVDHLTLQTFGQFKDGGLHSLPDLVSAYFALLSMFVRSGGVALTRSTNFDNILACALVALTVQETEAVGEVLGFWATLVDKLSYGAPDEATQIIIHKLEGLGADLVKALWDGLMGSIAKSRHEEILEVLDLLLKANTQSTMSWLVPLIQTLPAELLPANEGLEIIEEISQGETASLMSLARRVRFWQKKQSLREQQ